MEDLKGVGRGRGRPHRRIAAAVVAGLAALLLIGALRHPGPAAAGPGAPSGHVLPWVREQVRKVTGLGGPPGPGGPGHGGPAGPPAGGPPPPGPLEGGTLR